MFYYHMKLHYSQTTIADYMGIPTFYYHMKLHYSQTVVGNGITLGLFYYHMKLHYSQTPARPPKGWRSVLLPYEITLLSNSHR